MPNNGSGAGSKRAEPPDLQRAAREKVPSLVDAEIRRVWHRGTSRNTKLFATLPNRGGRVASKTTVHNGCALRIFENKPATWRNGSWARPSSVQPPRADLILGRGEEATAGPPVSGDAGGPLAGRTASLERLRRLAGVPRDRPSH